MSALTKTLEDQYRCPEAFLGFELQPGLSTDSGFFRFGADAVCYGHTTAGFRSSKPSALYDANPDARIANSTLSLPFDPAEVVDNLRLERYAAEKNPLLRMIGRRTYYRLRPFLHRQIRERIQRFQLRGWQQRSFPAWPVDTTVENLHERLLLLTLKATGVDRIPFIWFWPDGQEACTIMTHDVEGEAGRDFCEELMELNDSYGIKAAFQLVPAGSYTVPEQLLASMRQRGFEIGIQDFNHDGRLYNNHTEFLRRAKLINEYAREYGAHGFRSAVLYRKPEWFDAFEMSFDMSIPNTAHLDPQRGGCCTVMPYFIGNILELPVTAIQDYMLFNLLGSNSIDLWKRQTDLIVDRGGLVSFIVHPDYVTSGAPLKLYEELLRYLSRLREQRKVWFSLPSDVNRWWRQRSKMQLVWSGNEWHIRGDGANRAVIAYASLADGNLVYELQPALKCSTVQQPC